MTVTQEQIDKVKAAGFQNVEHIANACNTTGCKFYVAVAMIEKESRGRNVYGHDAGGALSGFANTVNKGNYEVFEWLVFAKGQTSNGVGPAQLTFKGFFTDMKTRGLKPWEPADNILYGVTLLQKYYRAGRDAGKSVNDAIRYAGTKYNGASSYGDSLLAVAEKWHPILGNVDFKK